MDVTNHNQVMGEITDLKVSMARLTTQFGHMTELIADMKECVEKLTPRNDSAALEKRIAHVETQLGELKTIMQGYIQRGKGMWLAANLFWAIAFAALEVWRMFK